MRAAVTIVLVALMFAGVATASKHHQKQAAAVEVQAGMEMMSRLSAVVEQLQTKNALIGFLETLDHLEMEIRTAMAKADAKNIEDRAYCSIEIAKHQDAIASLQAELERLAGVVRDRVARIADDENHIAAARARIAVLEDEIAALEKLIIDGDDRRSRESDDNARKIKEVREALAAMDEVLGLIQDGIVDDDKRDLLQLHTKAHKHAAAAGHASMLQITTLGMELAVLKQGGDKTTLLLLAGRIIGDLHSYLLRLLTAESDAAAAWASARAEYVAAIAARVAEISDLNAAIGRFAADANSAANERDAAERDIVAKSGELSAHNDQLAALIAACERKQMDYDAKTKSWNGELDTIAKIRQLIKDKVQKKHIEDNIKDADLDWETGAWSECSSKCGGGRQSREVKCPADDTSLCKVDIPESMRDCNPQPCPVDCVMSEWSAWSGCSRTCGKGVSKRTRYVVVQAANGGKDCPAELSESADCNPQDCQWSYGAWSACTKRCNSGTQSRSATCPEQGLCNSDAATTQACNQQSCPAWTVGAFDSCVKSGDVCSQSRSVSCPADESLCLEGAAKPAASQSCTCPNPFGPCDNNAKWSKIRNYWASGSGCWGGHIPVWPIKNGEHYGYNSQNAYLAKTWFYPASYQSLADECMAFYNTGSYGQWYASKSTFSWPPLFGTGCQSPSYIVGANWNHNTNSGTFEFNANDNYFCTNNMGFRFYANSNTGCWDY